MVKKKIFQQKIEYHIPPSNVFINHIKFSKCESLKKKIEISIVALVHINLFDF